MDTNAVFAEILGGVGTAVVLGGLQILLNVFTSQDFLQGCRTAVMVLVKIIVTPVIGFFLTVVTFVIFGGILDPSTDAGSTMSLVLIIGWTVATWHWLGKWFR